MKIPGDGEIPAPSEAQHRVLEEPLLRRSARTNFTSPRFPPILFSYFHLSIWSIGLIRNLYFDFLFWLEWPFWWGRGICWRGQWNQSGRSDLHRTTRILTVLLIVFLSIRSEIWQGFRRELFLALLLLHIRLVLWFFHTFIHRCGLRWLQFNYLRGFHLSVS